MARCRLGEKKIKQLIEKTGLPIITALARGGTDHRIDLCLNDGSIMCLFKDGTMKKSSIGWNIEDYKKSHNQASASDTSPIGSSGDTKR